MAKKPSFDFDTRDWLIDLAVCSPSTRGIWIDLLCAMHEAGRTGELSGTPEQLARIARCSVDEITAALAELAATKTAEITSVAVASQDNRSEISESRTKVVVINRRMKREHEKRQRDARQALERRKRKKDTASMPHVGRKSAKCQNPSRARYKNTKSSSSKHDDDTHKTDTPKMPHVTPSVGMAYQPHSKEWPIATRLLGEYEKLTGKKSRDRKTIIQRLCDGYTEADIMHVMRVRMQSPWFKDHPVTLSGLVPEDPHFERALNTRIEDAAKLQESPEEERPELNVV